MNGLELVYSNNTHTLCVWLSVCLQHLKSHKWDGVAPHFFHGCGGLYLASCTIFSSSWYNLWLERIIPWNNICSYCIKPHPSCYNNAILKKLVVFLGEVTTVQVVQQAYWKRFMIFHLSRNAQVRMNVRCEGSFAKLGWSCGACEWAVNGLWLTTLKALCMLAP